MLAWVDIETTGLSSANDSILEVAVIATDDDLAEVARFHRVIYYSPAQEILHCLVAGETPDAVGPRFRLHPAVIKMHAENGLWKECIDGALHATVVMELAAFLEPYRGAQLAGSTVSFDRGFLAEHMPIAHNVLHYRNLDVTSVNELLRRSGDLALKVHDARPRGESPAHRAVADIEESLRVARFYRRVLSGALTHLDNQEPIADYCAFVKGLP